jgi:hypothetical protein
MIVNTLKLQRVDLVKIDVEGAELQVLWGMKEIMQKFRPRLIIEIREDKLMNMGTSPTELRAFLRQNRYAGERRIDGDNFLWSPI